MTAALPRVAVATITLVRTPGEDALLRSSLSALARTRLPVFVADGGSGAEFVEFLGSLPSVQCVAPDRRGLIGQVSAAMRAAASSGAEYVLYTESDKQAFFEDRLHAFIQRATVDASVAIAGRSAESYATFPPLQRYTEGVINTLTGDVIGVAGDYSYGPFVVHRDLALLAHEAPDDLGWGWRHLLFASAHRRGRAVRVLVDDHPCPPDQREEDEGERLHRLTQLAQNVRGLALALGVRS